MLVKAGQADATPLHEGLTVPGEIAHRQERKAALEQTNFTDPHSRIMKSGCGYVQACNAQAAVEVDSRPSATTLGPGIWAALRAACSSP